MRIPLASPDISEQDIEAVTAVLRTSSLSLGPKVQAFENVIANYVGVSHAVAVSSGTSGLHLCIRALNISAGDEVVVPSFAFIAVANAVRYENFTPVFVDIDRQTLNLDPALVEAAITSRTRAIILVHTFGVPADLSGILEIAKRHRLCVIEDACEAIGAEYQGRKVGVFGDVGVFAFYPNKQITTGEGGAVVTNSAEIAVKIRKLRNQGRDDSEAWLQHSELGYNYRISDINCALGIEQMKRIESILERRKSIAETYHEILNHNGGLGLPPLTLPNRKISWFVYVVQLNDHLNSLDRNLIVSEMKARGIGLGRYFAPIHMQPIYKMCSQSQATLRVTESVASRSIALPFFNRISINQIYEVCETLVELLRITKRTITEQNCSSAAI